MCVKCFEHIYMKSFEFKIKSWWNQTNTWLLKLDWINLLLCTSQGATNTCTNKDRRVYHAFICVGSVGINIRVAMLIRQDWISESSIESLRDLLHCIREYLGNLSDAWMFFFKNYYIKISTISWSRKGTNRCLNLYCFPVAALILFYCNINQ